MTEEPLMRSPGRQPLPIPSELRRRMVEAARLIRKKPMQSEALLWSALRGRRLQGRKFRRQHPIGPFIVDFYCGQEGLVVEVKGPIHRRLRAADIERQKLLEAAGLRVLRVTSAEIEADIDSVLLRLRWWFQPSPPTPLPQAGEA